MGIKDIVSKIDSVLWEKKKQIQYTKWNYK